MTPKKREAMEQRICEMVDAIEDSFHNAGVPIGVGMAIGLTLCVHGLHHGEREHIPDIRKNLITSLKNLLAYVERDPAWVEQPRKVM